MQRERRALSRGGGEREVVPRHRAAAVVEDRGEPRLRRPPSLVEDPHVQFRVVRLPDLVRLARLAPVYEVEGLPVRLLPVVRQR